MKPTEVELKNLNTHVVCAKSLQSCLTLCDPMDRSPPGSSVHGILQARILEGVAMPVSRDSSQPRDGTHISNVSALAGGFFTTSTPWEAQRQERSRQCEEGVFWWVPCPPSMELPTQGLT